MLELQHKTKHYDQPSENQRHQAGKIHERIAQFHGETTKHEKRKEIKKGNEKPKQKRVGSNVATTGTGLLV